MNPLNQFLNQLNNINSEDEDLEYDYKEPSVNKQYKINNKNNNIYYQDLKTNHDSNQVNNENVEIKPKKKTFEELLNEQLNSNQDAIPRDDDFFNKKPIFEYKKNNRINEKLIVKPTEIQTKKYKYYSENFDKKFGTNEEKHLVVEEPSYNKKIKGKINKRGKNNTNSNHSNPIVKSSNKYEINKEVKENRDLTPINTPVINSIYPNQIQKNIKKEVISKPINAIPIKNKETKITKIEKDDYESLIAPIKRPQIIEDLMKGKFNNTKQNDDYENADDSHENNNVSPSKNYDNNSNVYNDEESDYHPNEDVISNKYKHEKYNHENNITEEYNKIYEASLLNNPPDKTTNNQLELLNSKNINQNNNQTRKYVDYNNIEEDEDDREIIEKYKISTATNHKPKKIEEEYNSNIINNDQHVLMNKYFKTNVQNNQAQSKALNVPQAQTNQIDLQPKVSDKIKELDNEIDKFKNENEKLNKLKNEYNKLTKELKQELTQVNELKNSQIKEFNIWKEAEMKKLEKDKKVHARNIKAMQEMPNRKEREEIDELTKQLATIKEEFKVKENKNKLNENRLKKIVDEYKSKNDDLNKQIKEGEEVRIKQMIEIKELKNQLQNFYNQAKSQKQQPQSQIQPQIQNNINTLNNLGQNTQFVIQQASSSLNINNKIQNKPLKQVEHVNQENKFKSNIFTNDNVKQPPLNSYDTNEYNQNNYYKSTSNNKNLSKPESKMEYYETNTNNEDSYNIDNEESNNKHLMNDSDQEQYNDNNNNFNITNNNKKQNETHQSKYKIETKPPIKNTLKEKDREKAKDSYEMVFLEKYHGEQQNLAKLIKQDITNDGKVIRLYENGKKVVIFNSGVRRETYKDDYTIVYFNNGDIKQTYPDGKTIYYYSQSKAHQTTFPDQLQVFKFSSGQIEFHYPDLTKKIIMPDGSVKHIMKDNYEETLFPDGSIKKDDPFTGISTIEFLDGSKIIIYQDGSQFKELPDGTLYRILNDGKMERVRNI